MKTPEKPKGKAGESSAESLKKLQKEMNLSPEAQKECKALTDVYAQAREARFASVLTMKDQKNIPKGELRKLEMVLTA